MLALVVPNEVASTPTEMLSETEALILNGGQVASTSSLGADEHLKGGLANFSLASEDASLEKVTSHINSGCIGMIKPQSTLLTQSLQNREMNTGRC